MINNHIYFFGTDGIQKEDGVNSFSPDGYITGNNVFITVNSNTYYIVNNTIVTNYYVINNHIYFFGTDGIQKEDGVNSFSPDGYITGNNVFITVNSNTYYIVNNTVVTNYHVINNHIYFFGVNGEMGEDGIYTFSPDGYIVGDNIFVTVNGDQYYIVNNMIVTNYFVINNHVYYFGPEGKLTEDGVHQFSSSGYILGNHIFINNTYYLVDNVIVRNYYIYESKIYYFDENGIFQDKIEDLKISLGQEEFVYNNTAHKPSVLIDGLVQGTDYTVVYRNNVDAGTAIISITGVGKYSGTAATSFVIAKAPVGAPVMPVMESKDHNTVVLVAVAGYEYRCGNGEWQRSNTFTGLESGKVYVFYQRIAEGQNTCASAPSAGLSVTTKLSISGVIVISGETRYGNLLTVDLSGMTDGNLNGLTYQWYVDDQLIQGATGQTYLTVKSDMGKTIKVVVTGIDDLTGSLQASVEIEAFILGDVDNDGVITDWDGILLNRYLAGWNVAVSYIEALDVDGDGEITDWDGVLLDRYLAGWAVNSEIGK